MKNTANPLAYAPKLIALYSFIGVSSAFAAAPNANIPAPADSRDVQTGSELENQELKSSRESVIERLTVDKSVQEVEESKISKGLAFVLRSVNVLGNETLDAEEIKSTVKPFIGKQVYSSDLKKIEQALTNLYRAKGYVTSRASLPPQKIQAQTGIVNFQIEEDKLNDVVLVGQEAYSFDQSFFEQYIYDLKGKIIDLKEINKRLLQLKRIPASHIKPTLKKTAFGKTDLILDVKPIEDMMSLSLNNAGSRFTGVNRATLAGSINNLAGKGDSLYLSFTSTEKTKNYTSSQFSYSFPTGKNGGKFSFGLTRVDYRLDPDEVGYDQVQYEGNSQSIQVEYSRFKLIETGKGLNFGFGMELKESKSSTVYNTTFPNSAGGVFPAGYEYVSGLDKLFVPYLKTSYEVLDAYFGSKAFNSFSVKLIHPIENFLGSMSQEDISRKLENIAAKVEPVTGPVGDVEGMKASFAKVYLNYNRLQQLSHNYRLQFALAIEYTDAKKVPSDYKYSAADGGPSGYSLTLGVSKPLLPKLTGALGVKSDNAISYLHATTPGCGGKNTSDDAYTCTDTKGYLTLNYKDKDWALGLQYYSDVQSYSQNDQSIQANLTYKW